MLIGTVRELWRYPVKSMRGERCDQFRLDERGVAGDRLYAVRDEAGKFGSGKTTRRFRRIAGLFQFQAVYDDDIPLLTFPDGTTLRGDDPAIHTALSSHLGVPVTLSREALIAHFDAGPLHLLTTASIRALGVALPESTLDARRFRPNILIESEAPGFSEEAWQNRQVTIGADVRLRILGRTERCAMITFAQDELPNDPRILRAVVRENDAHCGVYANALVPGAIQVGDRVDLL